MLVNSIKEGQVFLSERLPQLAAFEQPRFRSHTAAACLRQILLNSLANKKGNESVQVSQSLFLMSLQLNPESEQALALLDVICQSSNRETSALRLKELMGLAADSTVLGRSDPALDGGLRSLLKASVGLRDKPISDVAFADLTAAIKATPVNGIVASRFAVRLLTSDSIQAEEAIKWMRAINVAAPEVLIAWSERAKLHLLKKEYSNAVECYEFLLEKLPGNEQLIEAMDAAKSQLTAGE